MDTKHDLAELEAGRVVYVRSIQTSDLPEDVQLQVDGLDHIYAVCNTEGERLALVKDRELAFALARHHDMAPVAVH